MKNKKYVTGLVIAVAGLVLALAPAAPTPFLPLSDLLHNVLRDTP